jgi:serine/threonine-protein kinase
MQGKLDEAAAEFRLAQKHRPTSAVARRLQLVERLLPLQPRLPALVQGKQQPANLGERLALADFCQTARCYAAAARLYAGAFAEQPGLADDLTAAHRYNAACYAALAGSGLGLGAPRQDDGRARLRQQALDWLRADLALQEKRLQGGLAGARATVREDLRHWQTDADLAGLRDTAALEKLPEAERHACRELWADVDGLLKRAAAPGKSGA